MVIVPLSPSTTSVRTYIDLGGAVGYIYPRIFTFPRGSGIPRPVGYTTSAFTLDTWEANGGKVKIVADGGNANVYDIRIVIYRIHKAR